MRGRGFPYIRSGKNAVGHGVNADLLETEDLLNLNLSDDATYPISRTRTEERHAGDFTWYGETGNEPFGNAIFVVQNREVTGTIRTGDGAIYALRPLTDGLHALIRPNMRKA